VIVGGYDGESVFCTETITGRKDAVYDIQNGSRGKIWMLYVVWGKFRLGNDRIRREIFGASPDNDSEWTSLDTVEFTMFIPENVA
jgi:hypothetical protein